MNEWSIDSEASNHMVGMKDLLVEFKADERCEVTLAACGKAWCLSE